MVKRVHIHPNPENHKEEKGINHITQKEALNVVNSYTLKENKSLYIEGFDKGVRKRYNIMIITLIKEETTQEYNKKMEKKYGSMGKLEKALEKTPKNILYADLQNWKLLSENPEENIKIRRNYNY